MTENIINGLRISGLGLLGVFGVLLIFYVIVILLGRIKAKEEE
mgnify:CR=1 FL=1